MLISLRPVEELMRSWLRPRKPKTIRRRATGVRPWLESLEDRLAPTAGLTAGNQQLVQSYGQLPISFEVNAGQTDAQVRYLAHGSGYALFLTSTGAVLNLQKQGSGVRSQESADVPAAVGAGLRSLSAAQSVTGVALAMNLIGANPYASISSLDPLPGTSNYFIGNNPSQWHTNIPNYSQVAYQGVYPGVNLVYYGNQQQLEYDFVVAPGADPTRIRFAIQGADRISLDEQGNLVLSTAFGDVLEHAPLVYQESGGARQAVAGQFVLLGQDEVGFQVSAYDPSLPLIIDPVLSYSTYLGGNGFDQGHGIAVDGAGDAYVTGNTSSTDFPTTTGAYQTTIGNGYDASVTKLNATGTALIYSTYLGGDGYGIAVDGTGNAYVTGTAGPNFPTTAGAFQTSLGGTQNGFVTKLNATGTALIYSTYLGGSGDDSGLGIAVDSSGNAYVTGYTNSTNFPTTAGAYQTSLGGTGNAFVTKLNATGTALIYSTYLGGSGDDGGLGIAVDGAGDAYVTGDTSSADFPTTPGAFQTILGGGANAFVTKLNASGTALIYSTYLGGNGIDDGFGIALDGAGNAYVTGATTSTDFPTTAGAFQRSSRGSGNGNGACAFVTKLNANGTGLIYSTYLGGSSREDIGQAIALDVSGNAYVTGRTKSTNFPTTTGAYQTRNGGGTFNAFVTKLNATGAALIYSTYLGGNSNDAGWGIALDASGNAYVNGTTTSTNFPTTAGAYQTSLAGTYNAFVAKFTFATASATQFAISNLSTTSVGAGGTVTFTVTAEDSTGAKVPGYTGTVQLSSTDGHASFSSNGLPASYTFAAGDNGVHIFTVMLGTAGSQTITVTDQANKSLNATTGPITVTAGPFSQFVVSVPGGNTIAAGNPFLFTAQAADQFGNPVTSYGGPTSVTATASPPDPQGNFPITGTLNSSGFGFFLGNLKTAGSYTLTTTAGSFSGASGSLTVTPGAANYITITAPAAATTGSPFDVTVTAFDHFGNIATGYTGTVKLTSTDPATANLVSSYTFTTGAGNDNGVHTFSATLNTAGSQAITATDTLSTNPTITGTSGAITTRGLTVTSFTPTATGFTATFSKPFNLADLTLYGPGLHTLQDVTLIGAHVGPINGSLIIDPSNISMTFNATANGLSLLDSFGSVVLPDDTYTVTLVSGSGPNGFQDALGTRLDGAGNGGHANYTTTFATHYQANNTPVLSIPDFARGPDDAHNINVPNDSGHGIPVSLYNAASVKDITFTLSYNPSLLAVAAASSGDATDPASSFTLVGAPTIIDATHATANFHFSDSTAQSGTVILGDVVATVPSSAAGNYKAKELLQLGSIVINQGAITGAVGASGVHINAYFGDVTGNGTIDGLDVATAANLAQGKDTGFAAYQLLDPAIVGDVAQDYSVDAGNVSDLAAFTVHLPTPVIPAIPTGLTITPVGADPTLSLGESSVVGRIGNPSYSGIISVPVFLDQPHPVGSTGMTEAILALTYDPSVLSVSASDITLGSISGLGQGWQLTSLVDQVTGQIAIILYSTTPITATEAGSLVNIEFHVPGGERRGVSPPVTTPVQLVSSIVLNGQEFATQVDDAQGQLVLSPGIDRVLLQTDVGWPRTMPSRSLMVRLSSRIG